ncbi:MAG TPA: indole-3-glycerol phosphate synthase TrpC [Gemmatimonadales bacterium]|nr:indole-3-glycerol phosphate synthase TrpC [Gemmatimonadales bacterium]
MPVTLDQILTAARARAGELAGQRASLERDAADTPAPRDFSTALLGGRVAVIAEIKRRSPSAGVINASLDPAALARIYQSGGASAVSVLTDAPFFGGSLADLREVTQAIECPVLRKDFIVSEEQLLEARAAGAAAALLIVRALEQPELARLTSFAGAIGLTVLVETHDATEIARALDAGATVIGVNSRDLDTFTVDVPRALSLLARVPSGCIAVAESGVASRDDIARAAAAGADAVLVGSVLSGAADPGAQLQTLTGVSRHAR